MAQNILSYTSRDFDSIRTDLINAIPNMTNIWTNREDADPGMVLLTLISALGDNLSFNMDQQSLEFFGRTVTQRKNAAKVLDLIGYKLHWYKSATLDITVYNTDVENDLSLNFNIIGENNQRVVSSTIDSAPPYFLLNPSETPANWSQNTRITIPAGGSKTFKAVQGSLNSITFNSSAIDTNNRYYLATTKIDQDHLWLQDDHGYQWYIVDSINELTSTLPRFEFGVDEYNLPYIEFVPYWDSAFGKDHIFTLYYLNTRGSSGSVTTDILNKIPSIKSNEASYMLAHGSNTIANAVLNNVPGKDPQTARAAYYDSRNYVGTYNTLVTLADFEKFMSRLDIISAVTAVDGQRANDYNELLSLTSPNRILPIMTEKYKYRIYDSTNKYYLDILNNPETYFGTIDNTKDYFTTAISNLNIYFEISPATADRVATITKYIYNGETYTCATPATRIDILGIWYYFEASPEKFDPYTLQLHMVAGDFFVEDPTLPATSYATETPIIVDSTNNTGYIEYQLTDTIIGISDDSTVSQSKLNDYKLFTVDVSYGPVRKFPFYIDGQLHLKEPVRPAEANLILGKVFSTLQTFFSAYNLTMGEKLKFSYIISIINNADENIDYFDAGANNSHGSLVVYPTTANFNPYAYNIETDFYDPYEVNIDPQYFNMLSMQHYEDILQQNNSLIYWGDTLSHHLSIAPDSILEKNTPITSGITASISYTSEVVDEDTTKYFANILVDPYVYGLYMYRIPKYCVVDTNRDLVDSVPTSLGILNEQIFILDNTGLTATADISDIGITQYDITDPIYKSLIFSFMYNEPQPESTSGYITRTAIWGYSPSANQLTFISGSPLDPSGLSVAATAGSLTITANNDYTIIGVDSLNYLTYVSLDRNIEFFENTDWTELSKIEVSKVDIFDNPPKFGTKFYTQVPNSDVLWNLNDLGYESNYVYSVQVDGYVAAIKTKETITSKASDIFFSTYSSF